MKGGLGKMHYGEDSRYYSKLKNRYYSNMNIYPYAKINAGIAL